MLVTAELTNSSHASVELESVHWEMGSMGSDGLLTTCVTTQVAVGSEQATTAIEFASSPEMQSPAAASLGLLSHPASMTDMDKVSDVTAMIR